MDRHQVAAIEKMLEDGELILALENSSTTNSLMSEMSRLKFVTLRESQDIAKNCNNSQETIMQLCGLLKYRVGAWEALLKFLRNAQIAKVADKLEQLAIPPLVQSSNSTTPTTTVSLEDGNAFARQSRSNSSNTRNIIRIEREFTCRTLPFADRIVDGEEHQDQVYCTAEEVQSQMYEVVEGKAYKINRNSPTEKGVVLVINNVLFYNSHDDRTEKNEETVRHCVKQWLQLNYSVLLVENLTVGQMKEELERFVKSRRHNSADSVIIVMMSHGEQDKHGNDMIFGVDGGTTSIAGLLDLLRRPDLSHFNQLPKLVIIQACRNGPNDGTKTNGPSILIGWDDETEPRDSRSPTASNILQVFATSPGCWAIRHLLMKSIYKVFSSQANKSDVLHMLLEVNKLVWQRGQLPEVRHSHTKKFYLCPLPAPKLSSDEPQCAASH